MKDTIPHRIFSYQRRQEYFGTMVIPLSNDQQRRVGQANEWYADGDSSN